MNENRPLIKECAGSILIASQIVGILRAFAESADCDDWVDKRTGVEDSLRRIEDKLEQALQNIDEIF